MNRALAQCARPDRFAMRYGHVRSITTGMIEATGPDGTLGDLCSVATTGDETILAEIVALDERRILLSPLDQIRGVALGARVEALDQGSSVAVGDAFAGRLIDALGQPIDGLGELSSSETGPLHGHIPGPLERTAPSEVSRTGVKAVDGLLTLGKGQRVGVVAASGVGKTSLMEQLAFQADADHVIFCLVGERGREVEGLWKAVRSRDDADRFTIVAATSDESAAHRSRCPLTALALAEDWRSKGRHVLLFIDSVTRLAMALREIGLAAGAPPTVRAYTPNVFSALPRIVERCGAVKGGGAITAIMTVLSETDEVDDPIVEIMKSLLDGHIILSRAIAEQGQFPAIDVVRSVSRGIEARIATRHRQVLRDALAMLGAYSEARVMIETGAYRAGTNVLLDRAIARHEPIQQFLRQAMDESVPFETALAALITAVGGER